MVYFYFIKKFYAPERQHTTRIRTSTLSVPVKVEAQHVTYNDGSAIGAGSDDTSDFERGGGMRLNVDTLLAQRKNEIEQLRFVNTTKKYL